MKHVLKACGDDLSTENILKQAYSIKDLELPMLLPGIKINTSPTDHVPVDQMQFMRFNGKLGAFWRIADGELTSNELDSRRARWSGGGHCLGGLVVAAGQRQPRTDTSANHRLDAGPV